MKFAGKLRPISIIIIVVVCLVVGYQAVLCLIISHQIKHSYFLKWCQNLSVSDIEFVVFSDPWQREMFFESYILSASEEEQLVDILNHVNKESLLLVDTPFRTDPAFTVYVNMGQETYLFQRQTEAENIFYVTPSTAEESTLQSVGSYNKLILICPQLVDFALEISVKSELV